MMRTVLAAVLLVPLTVAAGDLGDRKKNCRNKWPGDAAMQNWCKNQQRADRKEWERLRRKGGDYRVVADKCRELSPGVVRGIDWQDAMACTRASVKRMKRKR